MAAKAGIVTIDVAADVAKLVRGMNRAENITKKTMGAIKKLVGAAAIATAFVKTTRAIDETIDSMDALAKTASKIGTTTRELSQLQYTADFAGVSTEALNMSLQRLQRRSIEAADGSGAAKDALAGLGLEAKSFSELPLSEKMEVLADKLMGVTSESRKLEIAFGLFGREGTGVLNMLKGGSAELQSFARQADKAGATIEDAVAKKAEQAKDAFTAFDYAQTAVANSLTAKFLPTIIRATNAMLDFFDIPRKKGIQELGNQIQELNKEISDMEEKLKKSGGYGGVFTASPTAIRKKKEELEELKNIFVALKNEQKVADSNRKGEDFLKGGGSDGIKQLIDTILPARAALRDMNLEIKTLNDNQDILGLSSEELAEAQANIVKRYEDRIGVGRNVNKNTKEAIDLTKQLTDVVGSKLENAFMSTFRAMMDGTADFKDTMVSMIKDIIAEFMRLLVIKQAAEAVSGAISGYIAGGAAGSRAGGGGVVAGNSYLVGERGAEVFTPTTGGTISSAGGTTINVNNYASAEVETRDNGDSIDIIIRQIEPMIADGIKRKTSPIAAAIQGMK